MTAGALTRHFDAYAAALDRLPAAQTMRARAMAREPAAAFVLSRALLLAFGGAALLVGGVTGCSHAASWRRCGRRWRWPNEWRKVTSAPPSRTRAATRSGDCSMR